MKLKNRTYKIYKIIVLVVLLFLFPSTTYSKKINVCGTDSIWRAYLYDNSVIDYEWMFDDPEFYYQNYPDFVDKYYPEEFFTQIGASIPNLELYKRKSIVPYFEFKFPTCQFDSFYVELNIRFSDRYQIWNRAIAFLSFHYNNNQELDFNEILNFDRNRNSTRSSMSVDSKKTNSELRYGDVSKLWFKYKDGVLTNSNGGSSEGVICYYTCLGVTWEYLGGTIESINIKIDDDEYYEDFRDCSNALVYNDCPPREPDKLSVICEQIPDCRNSYYKFYTESNLDELHWVSLDGLAHDGDKLTLPLSDFNGGCIAVWGKRDHCSPPIYDTICPPIPIFDTKETNIFEDICWNEPFFVNGKRVTESGYYSSLFKTSEGCDSIVNYNIMVNSGDTLLGDSVFRCDIDFNLDDNYVYDTIEIVGSCPNLKMSPIGIARDDRQITISKVKEEPDVVYVDVSNNVGDVTYTTIWMGKESEHRKEGILEFDDIGKYTIIAYDEETGCSDSMSFDYRKEIKPDPFFNPYDSDNGKWNVRGLEKYNKYQICIYDRFGKRLVCYNDEFDGWDGVYNGHPMPSTDYWYTIEVDDINYFFCGHFTLYRFDK